MKTGLKLPARTQKPRNTGMTIVIDNGLPTGLFIDFIQSHHLLVDTIKFGWGTALVTEELEKKIAILKKFQINFFFGGTLFEKFLQQNNLNGFHNLCKRYHCEFIEISNGTIKIDNSEKCHYIKEFSTEFKVFSEVGYKDPKRSEEMSPTEWSTYIEQDIEAGAYKVFTESRESGKGGICHSTGKIRTELISEILSSSINVENIIFEAPNKALQMYFIKQLGTNVNLANIALQDIISLETLRLGLRSDTFYISNKDIV